MAVVADLPSRLFNPGVEVVIFIFIECVTRLTVPKTSNTNQRSLSTSSPYRINLLATQAALLVLAAVLCTVLHHTPYILSVVTAFVVARLLSFTLSNEQSSRPVSKPLRSTPESEDTSGMQPLASSYSHEELERFRPSKPAQVPSAQYTANLATIRGTDSTATANSYLKDRPLDSFAGHLGRSERAPQGTSCDFTLLRSRATAVTPSSSSQQSSTRTKPTAIPLQRPALTSTQSRHHPPASTGSSLLNFCHGTPGYFSSFLEYSLPSKTPPGLTNPGNTCFINSTLQCLAWTEGFLQVVPPALLNPASQDPPITDFLKALNTTLHQCHVVPDAVSRFKTIDTSPLLDAISKLVPYLVSPPGVYQSQQDAAEFLLWLLDQLHGILRSQPGGLSGLPAHFNSTKIAELRQTRNECLMKLETAHSDHTLALRQPLIQLSEVDWSLHWQEYCSSVYSLFLGQLIEARECQQCMKVSVNVEYFTVLSLPVLREGQEYRIDDSFQRFNEVEDLTLSNMMHCSCATVQTDSLAPGKRLALLSKPPQRLVVQLSRYSYDSMQNEGVKNTASISFPLSLNLFPHTMQAKLNISSQESCCYKLCAFCIHTGAVSTSFGHYVAYAVASNGKWYSFNDSTVYTVNNIESELETLFVKQNAYMLFYTKST